MIELLFWALTSISFVLFMAKLVIAYPFFLVAMITLACFKKIKQC